MQLKALTALLPAFLAFTGVTTAFTIPADLEPGAYGVTYDAAGIANITKIEVTASDGSSSAPERRDFSVKLDKRNSQAKTGRSFPNHGDYNWCTATMKFQMDNGLSVRPHSIYFVVGGDAFLALCNYSPNSQGGFGWEVDNFNALMDTSYGAWETGWWHISGPDKTLWRDIKGTPICTNIGA